VTGLVLAAGLLAVCGQTQGSGRVAPNVLIEGVTPVPRNGDATDPALLLVYVVDPDGVPLPDVEVSLLFAKGNKGAGRTAKDGTALLRSSEVGRLIVRASRAGYVSAEARNVLLRRNGITVVGLALQSGSPP
jgi:carboxypeptidase family protein